MNYRQLGRTGLRVSELGFGASPLGDVFGRTVPRERLRAVHCAVDAGINYFDVAPYYGNRLAEERLGAALAGRRDRVVLATKCGRHGDGTFDFTAARVARSVEGSLRRLRTSYLDVLLAHDIEFTDEGQILTETLPAIERLRDQGKVRFVGVSGLPLRLLRRVAGAGAVDIVLSYCRYNLLIDDLDTLLRPMTDARGMGLINASPLHMGVLTPQGPPAWHPAPPAVREAGARAAAICSARGSSITEVALRFCLDYRYVSTTLAGMSSEAEVRANLRALETPIPPELLRELRQTIRPAAGITWTSGRPENQDRKEIEP